MVEEQSSVIVKTVARLLAPFIQIFGLYVIMHGHSSPGGGFQGGVIIGSSFILISIAYGVDEMKRRFSVARITVFTSLGVFIYAGIGVACLLLGANLLNYGILPFAEPRAMGMLGVEIGVGITVMAVVVSIFYDLVTFE
jgi:multicomponent Na+:H+ antiporter subunit B